MSKIKVEHMAVNALPGGVPMLWKVGPDCVTVLMSRTASVDELAAAFGPMYEAMSYSALTLCPVADVA
jgi:hypothetical protein